LHPNHTFALAHAVCIPDLRVRRFCKFPHVGTGAGLADLACGDLGVIVSSPLTSWQFAFYGALALCAVAHQFHI
jgi:hypothetical protein